MILGFGVFALLDSILSFYYKKSSSNPAEVWRYILNKTFEEKQNGIGVLVLLVVSIIPLKCSSSSSNPAEVWRYIQGWISEVIITCKFVCPDWAIYCTLGNFSNQLVCPNCPYFKAIFGKVSKSFIFRWNLFWPTFIDIWRLFTGLTACNRPVHFEVVDGAGKKDNNG